MVFFTRLTGIYLGLLMIRQLGATVETTLAIGLMGLLSSIGFDVSEIAQALRRRDA